MDATLEEIIELINRDSTIGHIIDESDVYEAIQELLDMCSNYEDILRDVESLIS